MKMPSKLAVVALGALALGFLPAALYHLLTETRNYTYSIRLGERQAKVTVEWVISPHLIDLGHQYLIEFGEDVYKSSVQFADGDKTRFTTDLRPRAIWNANGRTYVVCTDVPQGLWLIGHLAADGRITPIAKAGLPPGEIDWNLAEPDLVPELREDFERWAK